MVWTKLDITTLTAAADLVTTNTITATKFVQMFCHIINSGNVDMAIKVNNDNGTNYAYRESTNGAADSTGTSTTGWTCPIGGLNTAVNAFNIIYAINLSSSEKLLIGEGIGAGAAGAANVPSRREGIGKWTNTSTQFTILSNFNVGSGDYGIDTQQSILGTD